MTQYFLVQSKNNKGDLRTLAVLYTHSQAKKFRNEYIKHIQEITDDPHYFTVNKINVFIKTIGGR